MRNNWRRTSVSLAGVLALVASACAPAPSPAAGPGAAATPTAKATATPTPIAFKPSGPVEFVVHTGPGAGMDVMAREWIEMLRKEKLIDQPWTVNNQAGGSGARAMAYLVNQRAKTDVISGMTTVWLTTPMVSREVPNTYKNFTPIARMMQELIVAAVPADSPYRTFNDFVAAAKASPDTLVQAGGSLTSPDAMAKAVIEKATGAKWKFISIPSGGERRAALLGGTAQIMLSDPADFASLVRANRVRIIATISTARSALYPDVPTLDQQGIKVTVPVQVRGVMGPPNMPREAVAYYEDVLRKLTQTETWKAWAAKTDIVTAFQPGAEFGRFLDAEVTALQALLKELDLLPK